MKPMTVAIGAVLALGGEAPKLPHAHFNDRVLSTLPSSTLAAWATVFTGTPPAVHGVAGNEYSTTRWWTTSSRRCVSRRRRRGC